MGHAATHSMGNWDPATRAAHGHARRLQQVRRIVPRRLPGPPLSVRSAADSARGTGANAHLVRPGHFNYSHVGGATALCGAISNGGTDQPRDVALEPHDRASV